MISQRILFGWRAFDPGCVCSARDFTTQEPFEAVVGRLVLMYFPDPAAVLRRLSTFVTAGGIVTFQEIDMTAAKSEPHCPLSRRR